MLIVAAACSSPPPPPPPRVVPQTVELYAEPPGNSTYTTLPAFKRGTLGAASGTKSVWYHFFVLRGTTVRIDLSAENQTASSAWELFDDSPVHYGRARRQLGSGFSYTASQTFVGTTDIYYVRVFVADGVERADYLLSINATPPAPAPNPVRPKPPNTAHREKSRVKKEPKPPPALTFEPVEAHRSDAVPLESDTPVRLGRGSTHASRWFRIRAPYHATATITFRPDTSSRAPAWLELHGSTVLIRRSGPGRERQQITSELVAGGTFFIRVGTEKNGAIAGTLSVRYEHFLAKPSSETAEPLASGSTTTSVGGDTGIRWTWYSFRVRVESIVKMSLRSTGENAVATIYRDGTANVLSTLKVNPSASVCSVLPPGLYLIRIAGNAAMRATVSVSFVMNERSTIAGFTDVTSKPCP